MSTQVLERLSTKFGEPDVSESTEVPLELDPTSVKPLLEESQVVLIDCREQDEYDLAKIDGSILMPISQWNEVSARLDEFSGQRLVVHCHHGVRSLRVVGWLRQNGFPDAQSMSGGISAWSKLVDPGIPQY